MKRNFITLFNYDGYANNLILNLLNKAGNPARAVQLLAHVLAAQQIWLNRCMGMLPAQVKLWDDLNGDTVNLAAMITDNTNAWINYLNTLNDADFEKTINYKNTKGDAFAEQLGLIINHVINHGTHHRAQIGQQVKVDSESLPNTDFIFYLREKQHWHLPALYLQYLPRNTLTMKKILTIILAGIVLAGCADKKDNQKAHPASNYSNSRITTHEHQRQKLKSILTPYDTMQ